jgi:hypothetical protein
LPPIFSSFALALFVLGDSSPSPASPGPLATATPSNAEAGLPKAETAPPGDEGNVEALTPDRADYLPSRSWAGGSLHYGGTDLKVRLHGFVALEYLDSQANGARAGVSTFDLHYANIFLSTPIRKNLMTHIEVEFEHASELVEIDQAFIALKAKPWAEFTAGRFYAPFGIERFVWYAPINQLVSRPLALRDVVPGNFYTTGLKVGGLVGRGEHPAFTYEAALSNGLGDAAAANRRGSRQTQDNNSAKAFSGRASYVRWPYFEAGASLHRERYATSTPSSLRFSGADLAARFQGVEIRAEYVRASLDRVTSAGAALAALRQNGYYVQASYTVIAPRDLLPAVTVVLRRDDVDMDRALLGADDRSGWTAGANLKVYEHLRLKAEYQWLADRGPTKRHDNSFFAQISADF